MTKQIFWKLRLSLLVIPKVNHIWACNIQTVGRTNKRILWKETRRENYFTSIKDKNHTKLLFINYAS